MKKEGDIKKFWEDAELRNSRFKEIVKQIELQTRRQIPLINFDRKRIEEDIKYVKAKTKEIEERIIPATEDFFESEKDREDLHISIRVSCDFHKFLLDFGDTPPLEEATYVADTIRSGIDWFYLLAFDCHVISDDLVHWRFAGQATSNFIELRRECLSLFQILSSPAAAADELLGSLLSFIHLELVFMAQIFPFVVDSNLKENEWLTHRA